VNEIVADVLRSFRAELREHGIASSIKLASSIPLINGNKFQLHQVILNLVHNAIEAMASASGQERTLRLLTQRQDPGSVVVAVQDTGPGIEPKRLNEIFDAFVTTKAQGTGLGLAICRTIIERHGGQLSAWSDGKNGALFQVVLPIEPARDSSDA
jgi:signal transduction histidine kinase